MCISFANRKQKLPTIDIHFGQCDQMWQNYVTLAELHKSLAFFEGLLLYLANFLTYNSNFYAIGQLSLFATAKKIEQIK